MIPYFSKKNRIKRFVKRYRDEIGIELYKAEDSDWKGKADLVFHLNGVAYYRFSRLENLPFARFEKLQEVIIAMESKLTINELGNLLRAALGKLQDSRNGVKSALAEAEWIISETLNRRDVLHVNGDLLLEMIAITILRGDEKAGVIDSRIHDEKIRTFKAHMTELDFFLQSGISDLMPNLKDYSPEQAIKLLKLNIEQQAVRNAITAKLAGSVGNGK